MELSWKKMILDQAKMKNPLQQNIQEEKKKALVVLWRQVQWNIRVQW